MRQTRKQIIQRTLIYGLMSISVIAIVALLMLLILGYSFNSKSNQLEQGGLLQFDSVPTGAYVTVDGIQLGSRTPTKLTASAANHAVTMTRPGYRDWSKSIDLRAGMIGWLSYTRLVPTNIKADTLRTFPALAGALSSPDSKWFALLESTDTPTVIVANIQADKVRFENINLPAGSYTMPADGKSQTFELSSWSNNGEFILVEHTYDGKIEWLLLDRNAPEKTKNISVRLGLDSDRVVFASNNGLTALAHTAGDVRRLHLGDETISRPLVSNVDDFSAYGDKTILYTTKTNPETKVRTVGYILEDMDTPQKLADFPDDGQPVKVAMNEYFDKRYLATSHGDKVKIMTGDLPRERNKGSLKRLVSFDAPAPVRNLSFSRNGRFVIAETGERFAVYDLELKKIDVTKIKNAVEPIRPLRWIDSFMTWYDVGGQLRLYEFDGANQQNIMPVAEGYDVVISPNNKFLYSIGKDGESLTLQRVRMIIE